MERRNLFPVVGMLCPFLASFEIGITIGKGVKLDRGQRIGMTKFLETTVNKDLLVVRAREKAFLCMSYRSHDCCFTLFV